MEEITNFLQKEEDFQSIVDGLDAGFNEQLIAGVSGIGRPLAISTLYKAKRKKMLVITHQLVHAQQLYDDLTDLLEDSHVYLYPVNELIATEMVVSSPELRASRIRSVVEWLSNPEGILIVPVAALKRIVPPSNYWKQYCIYAKIGEQIDLEQITESLFRMGYDRVDMVTSPAEFSLRGGIIDIYPVTESHPIRIELFDDEIDSIRHFDANTQRSLENIEATTIVPAKELLVTKEDQLRAANRLEKQLKQALHKMSSSEAKVQLKEAIEEDIALLEEAELFQEMYKYSKLFYDEPNSSLDYFTEDSLIVFDDFNRVQEAATTLYTEESEVIEVLLEERQLLPNRDRKSTRLNSSHVAISYAVFCLKKKNKYIYLFLLILCRYQ